MLIKHCSIMEYFFVMLLLKIKLLCVGVKVIQFFKYLCATIYKLIVIISVDVFFFCFLKIII